MKGDEIVEHFKDKQFGFADALPGMLDGIPPYIFGMKEPDYTTTNIGMFLVITTR